MSGAGTSRGAVSVKQGGSPLVLSIPHAGTDIPPEVASRLNETGLAISDTDWWMPRLYDFAEDLDPTIVEARQSRYVIDVNRDPSGASLYPGQATTELCPTTTFDGEPLYKPGLEPGEMEIGLRRDRTYWPYHTALREQIDRVRDVHGYALLYDCHSIRSVVPRLFPGTLPVFNIGTSGGTSCAPEIEAAVVEAVAAAKDMDNVVNGRFKGGWITRHYGEPISHVHAVQMELAQRAYMLESPPWTYDAEKAAPTRRVLRRVLEAMMEAGARTYGESP
jgi:N-formylglutamate deformylase